MSRLALVSAPTRDQDLVPKSYVDAGARFQPSDHGCVGWTLDPAMAPSSAQYSTGRWFIFRAKVAVTGPISNILVNVTTLGSGLTSINFGIYTTAGVQLGVSADVKASFTTTGNKTVPLSSPTTTLQAGTEVLVAYLGVGTTLPIMTSTASVTGGNLGVSAGQYRAGQSTASSQTALPSPMTPSATTLAGNILLALLT